VRVLHHDDGVLRMELLDRVVQCALGHELDVLVDRQHQAVAGLGLARGAAKHVAPGIERGQLPARGAVQVAVEAALEPAQAEVVGADVSEHLRGQILVRVKALELLLKVDPFQVQSAHAVGGRRVELAGDPGEAARGVEAGIDLARGGEAVGRIGVDGLGQRGGGGVLVAHLGGDAVDGIDQHRHGQLMQVAVVEHSAARRDGEGALLLAAGQLDEVGMRGQLQPCQAQEEDHRPRDEGCGKKEEAQAPRGSGCAFTPPAGE